MTEYQWKDVSVIGFDALMQALDRADRKGYMPDAIKEEWEAFNWKPAQPQQKPEYKGWYCAHCQRGVDGSEVTYHEQHTVCGRVITDDLPLKPQQEPVAWKLVPTEPTEEMLKAMDECSKEGYDERLYAGHAASVYMAAVDAAPALPAQRTWVGLTDEERAELWFRLGYMDLMVAIEEKLKEKNA